MGGFEQTLNTSVKQSGLLRRGQNLAVANKDLSINQVELLGIVSRPNLSMVLLLTQKKGVCSGNEAFERFS
jgi:hypothetical protein